ncbi:SPOR domain-containing protein [Pseudoxanthomonas indica]|uniref:Cell division protein DedD (Protein involved in septation) n=1 Tax=Pseudoxanthomonas indica TaxID=428993 RepID=A0A1T5LNE6_9GAMM|nr:SPOR domain-containing protein [Pseudoxanthomonas indica]GGD37283.1 sporulation protein [Pseudoxanthomonas indica]SKC77444.1 Cell division protein DedD (protein involved in septation) [Pseudoxanthomonas indica]
MDTALKQRLIGAVVLVALAVIFLPMLVKGPAPDSGVSDIPLKVPDAPDGQFETRELPLVTPGDAPAGGAVGLPANTAPNPDAAALANPADAGAMPATAAAGNYAVSFGAYASPADAAAVVARLKQAKLPGYSETATVNGRTAYRVRIGPYADQATAESMRLEAVKVRNDVNAKVVVLDATAAAAAPTPSVAQAAPASAGGVITEALPPEPAKPNPTPAPAAASKPATVPATPAAKPAEAPKPVAAAPKPAATSPSAPAASSVGFAVQLGAFAKAEDANALRDKVRAGGYSAFVEQVRTDKGTLNRVRVGPVASRAEADTLKAQVASKFGINGMVRPHP